MDPATFTDPQAQATIEAARIGAAAAVRAAWVQASAAGGAFAAGVLAYIGAVRQCEFRSVRRKPRPLPIASGCSGWSRSTTTRSLALAPRLRLNLLPGLELGIHAPLR
jgi:hypothetical protein